MSDHTETANAARDGVAPSGGGAERHTDASLVAVFATHAAAKEAVKELDYAGIPMRQVSIIGKDYRTEERPIGFYNLGDRVRVWGARGAFWGGLIGLLVSPAFFLLPAIGHVIVLGPLTSALVGALEGAALGGGVSALAAALVAMGVPRDSVIRYEAAIKADKFVLILHGIRDAKAAIAKEVLRDTEAESVEEIEEV